MKHTIFSAFLSILTSAIFRQNMGKHDIVVANGKMPQVTTDKNNNAHIVYGKCKIISGTWLRP